MKSKFVLAVVIFSWSANSFAGFLRIVPNIQISPVEGKPGVIQITGTIKNDGDESAQNVMIETARMSRILVDAGALGSGEEREVTTEIAEKDIEIVNDGYYNIPLRVLYKDVNRASFSAAFITPYVKKTDKTNLPRSSPVTIGLDPVVQKAGGVDIARSGKFVLALSNTSPNPIEVNLEFVGTKEVEIKVEQNIVSLAPQEEKTFDVSVRNLSALPGSSYASYAMVSGVIEGQTYSDYVGFVVNVRSKAEIPFITWLLVGFVVLFGTVGFLYWRKDSKQEKEAAT